MFSTISSFVSKAKSEIASLNLIEWHAGFAPRLFPEVLGCSAGRGLVLMCCCNGCHRCASDAKPGPAVA